jgi:hypothetical protein
MPKFDVYLLTDYAVWSGVEAETAEEAKSKVDTSKVLNIDSDVSMLVAFPVEEEADEG